MIGPIAAKVVDPTDEWSEAEQAALAPDMTALHVIVPVSRELAEGREDDLSTRAAWAVHRAFEEWLDDAGDT